MSKRKYLVLLRSQPASGAGGPSGDPPGGDRAGPSPEQMQQMFAAFSAWKEKFEDAIFDMGDKLRSSGRVVTAAGGDRRGPGRGPFRGDQGGTSMAGWWACSCVAPGSIAWRSSRMRCSTPWPRH
ncbi:MAG: hypothetical protein WKG00_31390 [Polyangiaceae bacterium]